MFRAETFFLPILLIITLCSFYFAGDKAPRDKHLPKDMVLIPGDSITGPFYISTHEETNRDYWAYVQWTKCVFEWDFPAVYHATLPDTNVWSSHFSFNDPFVNIYHRHPAYWYYPVVGVSWVQANDYCRWKTDRLNEVTLSGKKMLEFNPYSTNWDNFSTEAFIFGQYETGIIPKRMDYTNFERQLWKDGLVSPSYRLPTEYEWELAYAYDSSFSDKENGSKHFLSEKYFLQRMRKYGEPHWTYRDCHFAETKGVSDISNNKEPLTKEVLANGNTLMLSGNISEWVLDYHVPNQPLNKQSVIEVFQDIGQPLVPPGDTSEKQEKEFTGKMRFTIIDRNADGGIIKIRDKPQIRFTGKRVVEPNPKVYVPPAMRGDTIHSFDTIIYQTENRERIYRGGSWLDTIPNKRGFLKEQESAVDIGFRCVMSYPGD